MNSKICIYGIILFAIFGVLTNQIVHAEDIERIQPKWTERLADWWLEETISDNEFTQSLTYLTNNEIIKIPEDNKTKIEFSNPNLIQNQELGKFSIFYMSIENYGIEPYPGRISTPEPYANEMDAEKIEVWLRQNKYFEKQIEYLNKDIKLPNNIKIGLGECQEKKAFYNQSSKMIVICYELIFDIYDRLTIEYQSKGISEKAISKITLDVIDFIFYQQISDLILKTTVDEKNTIFLKNNESLLDALANHLKLKIQQDKENYSIISIALWFKIMTEVENFKTPHFWSEKSYNFERLSNIACQETSFNSTATFEYIEKGILKKQNIIQCKAQILEQKPILEKITDQILK